MGGGQSCQTDRDCPKGQYCSNTGCRNLSNAVNPRDPVTVVNDNSLSWLWAIIIIVVVILIIYAITSYTRYGKMDFGL